MSILKVENLQIDDGNKNIVHDVSFEVNPGEIVAIFGGNNSGKSCIFKSILDVAPDRDLKFSWSRKEFNGRIVREKEMPHDKDIYISVENFRKSISYISQTDESIGIAISSVKESLYLSEQFEGAEKKEMNEYINSLFSYFNASKLKYRFLRRLSGGQRKLINIIGGLSRKYSKLYIFDEPLNNLDGSNVKKFSNYLIRLVTEINPDAGVLLITHCKMFPKISRAYILKDGTLKDDTDYYSCKSCFGVPDENGFYKED